MLERQHPKWRPVVFEGDFAEQMTNTDSPSAPVITVYFNGKTVDRFTSCSTKVLCTLATFGKAANFPELNWW